MTCSNRTPAVVTGIRFLQAQPPEEPSITTPERYLDCSSCWYFQDFRHNKDDVRDWSFIKRPMETGKKIGEPFFSKGLKGPITDLEMQKVVDLYLKNSKAPGSHKFQAELRVVRRYNSRPVFFQKVCIDCSPSSVRKVHPFDSGDATAISR